MGYATTFNQIYWLRAFMGFSEALYIPAGLSLISDYHTNKTRSLAIGLHMSGIYMGQALGGFGATFATMFSWQQAFHTFGFIGIAYSFILILFLKDDSREKGAKISINKNTLPSLFRGVGLLLTNISFWVILIYFAVPSLPGWGVKNWLPTLYAQNLHIEMSIAGPISTVTLAFSSLLGVIFGGILSDRWSQKNIRARVYTSAIGLSLTVPALFLISSGDSLFSVIGASFCFGFGFGIFDTNNMPILCQFVSSKYRATAYGLMNLVGVFSGAFITNILGKSSDKGSMNQVFIYLALIVVVALIIQLSFLRPKTNDFID
jgi:MFS family permease